MIKISLAERSLRYALVRWKKICLNGAKQTANDRTAVCP